MGLLAILWIKLRWPSLQCVHLFTTRLERELSRGDFQGKLSNLRSKCLIGHFLAALLHSRAIALPRWPLNFQSTICQLVMALKRSNSKKHCSPMTCLLASVSLLYPSTSILFPPLFAVFCWLHHFLFVFSVDLHFQLMLVYGGSCSWGKLSSLGHIINRDTLRQRKDKQRYGGKEGKKKLIAGKAIRHTCEGVESASW